MKSLNIGVIIPAYNEARAIGAVLATLPTQIKHKETYYTIMPVIVDDGSSDTTAAIARTNRSAAVITHILNSGAGAATRTGLRYLRSHDFIFGATMDADGQHNPADLERLIIAAIDGDADLIIGSRLIDATGMPWYKQLGNKGLGLITYLLLGVNSTDTQSGLKAFNRKTIDTLTYRENGYAFCSEMLWRAKKAGLKMADVPVEAIYTDYSRMKGQSNWNAIQIIKQLFKHRFNSVMHE